MTLKDRLRIALQESRFEGGSELARAIGITPASVSDWLTGKTLTMKAETATRTARALQVNPLWLSTGEGPMRGGSTSSSTVATGARTSLTPKMVAETALALADVAKEEKRVFDITTEEGAAEFIYWLAMHEEVPDAKTFGRIIKLDSLRRRT